MGTISIRPQWLLWLHMPCSHTWTNRDRAAPIPYTFAPSTIFREVWRVDFQLRLQKSSAEQHRANQPLNSTVTFIQHDTGWPHVSSFPLFGLGWKGSPGCQSVAWSVQPSVYTVCASIFPPQPGRPVTGVPTQCPRRTWRRLL